MSKATICYGIKYPLAFKFIWEDGVDFDLYDPEDCFEEWWKRMFPHLNQYIGITKYGFDDGEDYDIGRIICLKQSEREIDRFQPYLLSNQLFLSTYNDKTLIEFCRKYAYDKEEDEESPDFFIPKWYISLFD